MSDERKPLEPSDSQLNAIAAFIQGRIGFGTGPKMHYGREHEARQMWALIRDYALEEAAKACIAMPGESWGDGNAMERAAEMIRAMKGKP